MTDFFILGSCKQQKSPEPFGGAPDQALRPNSGARALRNPNGLRRLGHALGRLFHRRGPYECEGDLVNGESVVKCPIFRPGLISDFP
jgi:hypothetical protein